MHLAVTCGDKTVGVFVSVEVADPVADRFGASESNIDRLVRWQISNEPVSVVAFVVDDLGHLETNDGVSKSGS